MKQKLNRRKFIKKGSLGMIIGPFLLRSLGGSNSILEKPSPFDCILTPFQTGGPFYLDPEYLRSDISEEFPGIPLNMDITVLRMSDCSPVPNAVVNLWHCDHRGAYSEFGTVAGNPEDASNETFFRGYQKTNEQGICSFQTKFPGWYPGRATHFHFDVHMGFEEGGEVNGSINPSSTIMSQIYVSDEIKSLVYGSDDAYSENGDNPTGLQQDGIFGNHTELLLNIDQSNFPNLLTSEFCVGIDIPSPNHDISGNGTSPISWGQNFPNPFADTTTIPFSLSKEGHITISVYSIGGEMVEQLTDRRLGAGEYEFEFDRKMARTEMPAGTYIFEILFRDRQQSERKTIEISIIK